jgi:hypothetical protein
MAAHSTPDVRHAAPAKAQVTQPAYSKIAKQPSAEAHHEAAAEHTKAAHAHTAAAQALVDGRKVDAKAHVKTASQHSGKAASSTGDIALVYEVWMD